MKTLTISDSAAAELLAQLTADKPVVDTSEPDGFVRVTPTGPLAVAHGISRLYPTMASLGKPLNAGAWSWGVQMAFNNMRRPDGSLYLDQGRTYAVNASKYTANGDSVAKAGGDPSRFYAEAADREMHGDDWATQAELDKAAADAAAHAGAVWISTEGTADDGFVPVPE